MARVADGITQYSRERMRPLKKRYIGQVVENDDPKRLGRAKVEIPGLTKGLKKDAMPWYRTWQPSILGASTYSGTFAVPQVNTIVCVEFDSEDLYDGTIIGGPMNRVTMPNDKLNLSADYIHPPSSENHFTENWDKVDDTSPNQKHFSPDLTDDYPFTWGWVDPALNWMKVNMLKRSFEFVLNNFLKFKSYGNGDTLLHIPGNLKVVIEKDLYLEVRGYTDLIHFNSLYQHVIGTKIEKVEHISINIGNRGYIINGKNVVIS